MHLCIVRRQHEHHRGHRGYPNASLPSLLTSRQIAQAILLAVALIITLLRCYVRLKIEGRALTVSDYFIWLGWFCTMGWVICCINALNIQIDHPLTEDGITDSVAYLKVRRLSPSPTGIPLTACEIDCLCIQLHVRYGALHAQGIHHRLLLVVDTGGISTTPDRIVHWNDLHDPCWPHIAIHGRSPLPTDQRQLVRLYLYLHA